MVDMQVMISLQTGTAFFASTSLLAIGGGLALLRATKDALAVLSKLPIDISPSPALWEMKCVGLDPDLHLRLLQIRLVLPAVQLRRDHGRRDAADLGPGHRGSQGARGADRAIVQASPAGISTAASARSSSRSAISAGSSARGC